MDIDDIKITERYRKDLGKMDELAASIDEHGLLHPPVVTADGELIAGERRIEACKRLGIKAIHVNVVDVKKASDFLKAQRDENTVRKNFLPSEAVAIAETIELAEREAAEQRAEEGRRRGGLIRQGKTSKVESCHQPERAKTRDKVAQCVGRSGRTLEKAKKIVEAAKEDPQKYRKLVEEMDRTERIDGVYKKLKKMRQAEDIANEPPPLPEGPFRVLVVDPPWQYCKRAGDPSQRGALPYPIMTMEEIIEVPVPRIAHEDAILWLWTTNSHLPDAFEILEVWEFEYKTTLTWVKQRMGVGDWLRGQTEHCLLAVRGKPVLNPLTNQTTVLHAPVGEHSEKPVEFYQLVESLCPGSRVDLFARRTREGWQVYGDEVA